MMWSGNETEITLPGGFPVDDEWCRTAKLRPLTGDDEDWLLNEGKFLPPAAIVTELLVRCVTRLGARKPDRDKVRSLAVGDREALMLHLRRLTLGDEMSCVLGCPSPGCAEKMDLQLKVSELLLAPYPHGQSSHELLVACDDVSFRVRFRLPNGADQEAAVPLESSSEQSAVELLLWRCVEEIVEEPSGKPVVGLPSPVTAALSKEMAVLDPQADISLDLTCSACRRSFLVPFDAADFFHKEICQRGSDLYHEVHLLAFHYHWSEADILRMTRRRRHTYLKLLRDELREGRKP